MMNRYFQYVICSQNDGQSADRNVIRASKERSKKENIPFVSVVVMCANSTTIREILLAAEELGMVDSGEYVFFSIELSSR